MLFCSVCMYVQPPPGLGEDAVAETEMLTVVDGQMVCLRHVPCASREHWRSLTNGVRFESQGAMSSLSEYQKWRYQQDQAQGEGGGGEGG